MGEPELQAFTALSALHSDGWGMAWYDGPEPDIRRSLGRADREPEYDRLTHQPLGDLGLVHLRWATPGLAVAPANTHPFRSGRYVLAHNGAIHPQERLADRASGRVSIHPIPLTAPLTPPLADPAARCAAR